MARRCDEEGSAIGFDAAWRAFTGRDVADDLGDGWRVAVHPEDADAADLRARCRAGKAFETSYRLRRHDGAWRAISDREIPEVDADGRVTGWIGVCADVQDQVEVEARRARFLGWMSHELRTPLTATRTFLEVGRRRMLNGQPFDPSVLEQVSSQLERLNRLIGRLSDAGRLESGRALTMRLADVDLAELVRTAVAERERALARRTGHARSFEVDAPEHAMLVADADRLDQLLRALLDNAVQFSPEGGLVSVRLQAGTDEHVLTIADHGIGIPEHDLPRVTERYFRASNAGDEQHASLGLGLSIASEIVERHGGAVQIESEVGEGTLVRVALPVERSAR